MAAGGCIGCLRIQIFGGQKTTDGSREGLTRDLCKGQKEPSIEKQAETTEHWPLPWMSLKHSKSSVFCSFRPPKKIWKTKRAGLLKGSPYCCCVAFGSNSNPRMEGFHFTCRLRLHPLFCKLGYQTSTATHAPDIGKWVAGPLGRLGSGPKKLHQP